MNANSTARGAAAPASVGPCNPSPVHSSLRTEASKRPYTFPGVRPSARTFSPPRARCVCNVRRPGAGPPAASMISLTCAAVRSGRSRLSRNASSSISAGVRGATTRGRGTSASNPPRR